MVAGLQHQVLLPNQSLPQFEEGLVSRNLSKLDCGTFKLVGQVATGKPLGVYASACAGSAALVSAASAMAVTVCVCVHSRVFLSDFLYATLQHTV